jgi:hypothetical protein
MTMMNKLVSIIELLDENDIKKVYSGLDLILGKKCVELKKNVDIYRSMISDGQREFILTLVNRCIKRCEDYGIVDIHFFFDEHILFEYPRIDSSVMADLKSLFIDLILENEGLQIWERVNGSSLEIIATLSNIEIYQAMNQKEFIKYEDRDEYFTKKYTL